MRIITLVALAAAVLLASCSLELRDPDVASAQFVIQQAPNNVTSIVFVATNSAGEVRKYEISPTARAFKTELVAGVYVFELIMSVPTGTLTAITKAEVTPGEAVDVNLVMSHQSRMLAVPDLLNNRLTILNRNRDIARTTKEEVRTIVLKHLQGARLEVSDFWPRDVEFSRAGEIVVLSQGASKSVGYVASIDDSLGSGAAMLLDMSQVNSAWQLQAMTIDDLTNTLYVSVMAEGVPLILSCQLRACMATLRKMSVSQVTTTPIRGLDFHERYGVLLLAYGNDTRGGTGPLFLALDPATGRVGNEIALNIIDPVQVPGESAGWDVRVVGDRAYGAYAFGTLNGGGLIELFVSGTKMAPGGLNAKFLGVRRILGGTSDNLVVIDEDSANNEDRLIEMYGIGGKPSTYGRYGSLVGEFIFFLEPPPVAF